jgi:Domain of unknown function (DUF4062)
MRFQSASDGLSAPGIALAATMTAQVDGSARRHRRRPLRVFLSYTSELRNHPEERPYVTAAETAVIRAGHALTGMHHFPASDQEPADYCRRMVRAADVYVGIIGLSYGSPVRNRPEVSYTELEFETASDLHRPRLIFLLEGGDLPPDLARGDADLADRQRRFRGRLLDAGLITVQCSSPIELEARLFQALVELEPPSSRRRARAWLVTLAAICACMLVAAAVLLLHARTAPPAAGDHAASVIVVPRGESVPGPPTRPNVGGCTDHAAAGFKMGVCLANEHSYSDLIPDVYVNTQPPDPLDCALTIELWDGSGHRLLADDGHPCTRGHHYASQVARVLGGCSRPLHTSVWIRVAGRMVRIGDSKPFVFCD